MHVPALADHVGEAAWTTVCVTLLHLAVYRIAQKDLRVWIAVSNLVAGCKDGTIVATIDPKEGQDAKRVEMVAHPHLSRPAANTRTRTRHPMMAWIKGGMVSSSLAAPVLLSVGYQSQVSNTGLLEWTVVAIACILLTFGATTVLALFQPEVAVVAVPTAKHAPYGLLLADSRGKALAIGALDFDAARKMIPAVSLVLWLRRHPGKQGTALCNVCGLDGGYDHVGASGSSPHLQEWRYEDERLGDHYGEPPRDTESPKKEVDLADRMFLLSVLGNDLVRVCQYAQYGFLFSQITALLSFDYEQSQDQSLQHEKLPSSDPVTRIDAGANVLETSGLSTLNQNASVSLVVPIPRHVPPFSTPTFNGSIVGSYLATVIAVLVFPTRQLSTLWMPATLIGQSFGGALSVTWNGQWKALWRYEEV
ncbi:hypothetical protein QFC21_004009 [Naganishia friedmannii]|uniref:Uncharacterized protein n=1 Tax=Naganishia friedmannii TaxID=89922 RepID=A0ACC2VIB6_9TREE|nr:hypothetical protein QFC21_004009 [Naganishia friedmannii]